MRLLVDRQDHGMLGRIDIKADDVLELGGERGVVGAREGADAVRLQPVGLPDPLHRAQGDRCQRQTAGRPIPARLATSATLSRSAETNGRPI